MGGGDGGYGTGGGQWTGVADDVGAKMAAMAEGAPNRVTGIFSVKLDL